MDIIDRLDNVVRLETHIRRYMAITECSLEQAEQTLTSVQGPRLYRKMLREHLASGGSLHMLELSEADKLNP